MENPTPIGKTKTQGWEIGVSRTLPISAGQAWESLISRLGLPLALLIGEETVQRGLQMHAEDGTQIEIRSYTRGVLLRMTWRPVGWDNVSTLQLRVAAGKTGARISIHHEWLLDADQRDAMRQRWSKLLEGLAPGSA